MDPAIKPEPFLKLFCNWIAFYVIFDYSEFHSDISAQVEQVALYVTTSI